MDSTIKRAMLITWSQHLHYTHNINNGMEHLPSYTTNYMVVQYSLHSYLSKIMITQSSISTTGQGHQISKAISLAIVNSLAQKPLPNLFLLTGILAISNKNIIV